MSETCVCADAQSCPVLCDPMDCSPPGFSVHRSFQKRILEWVATPSSRRSFQTEGLNPHLLRLMHCKRMFYHGAAWETSYSIILVSLISHYENTNFQSHQCNHSLAVPTMLIIINMVTEKFIWGSLQTTSVVMLVRLLCFILTCKNFLLWSCLINSMFSVYFILLLFRDLKIRHYLS